MSTQIQKTKKWAYLLSFPGPAFSTNNSFLSNRVYVKWGESPQNWEELTGRIIFWEELTVLEKKRGELFIYWEESKLSLGRIHYPSLLRTNNVEAAHMMLGCSKQTPCYQQTK
jgi:hypothetical protein